MSPKEAIAIQNRLKDKVIREDRIGRINTVAGVDVGFEDKGRITRAAVAILEFPSLDLIGDSISRTETGFPYVPGLLSFRELPAVLNALSRLDKLPDLLLCDGQGFAHPRRFGIACHLGLLTGVPAIGVGKTRLVGTYEQPADKKGAWCPLVDKGEIIGTVLRTRKGVKPVYISSGHKISLESAIHYVLACTTRFKLPETTRFAHKLASNT